MPCAAWASCCALSDLVTLPRIFRRTPSLRTRVAFATAIGAAIVVTIVGTIVWIGITNDRLERLDRRLDEAAGFAVPFVPRGLDQIPPSPNDQDVVITVRRGDKVRSNSDVVLPRLNSDYATTEVDGVRYRVRTVELSYPEATTLEVGATYDDTIADTNNLHRRVLVICALAVGAAGLLGWLLATFAVRPLRRLAAQTRQIEAGDKAPDVEIGGATEAVEIGEAIKGLLERIWTEQERTQAALASARDFAAVSAHELRTPLTAMRTNLEVLTTLEVTEEQRNELLSDVARTQDRIEATLGALERLAQGELSTEADHVPVDITELLDRAAHDAIRVYPDLDVSLVPSPTCIIIGLPAGLRLAVDNAIANAVKHGGATRVQLSAVSSREGVQIAIDDNGSGVPEAERAAVFERFARGSTASHSGSGLGLALVAQQAELHGGTASLEDSALGGARLVLRLPAPH
ncbi:HAMP domain-containing histidine kinase [Mycolicibacterium sphagni]|uniref:histidine kinase n=1 Tax=Mycolicibacterium sphagni TaxID=1786 RepID=A0ABX2K1A3_9MYCO|nr:HAMP domain-containing histidine kinase [Mycolicibacterium sphagni]